jgi:hypothetical protein
VGEFGKLTGSSFPSDRIFVFYPVSASLTIFCNILLSPLHPLAQQDAALLRTVPSLVGSLQSQRSTMLREHSHVDPIDAFVKELLRLANRAMCEAQRHS